MATARRAFPWARIALACVLAVAIVTSGAMSIVLAGVLLLSILAIVTLGIFFAQLGLFARPIVGASETQSGATLALTFDDGPDPESTRAILALLAARKQRATFFVIGRRAEPQRELLDAIARGGHAIANHSFAHSHATPFLPPRVLADELRRAEAVLHDVRGKGRWFRAPVGIVSPRVAAAARLAGLELVSWTATARDGTKRATVESGLRKLRSSLRPGAILVLHDGAERDDRRPIAPALLARLLDEMDARGLRSVTLDELLREDRVTV